MRRFTDVMDANKSSEFKRFIQYKFEIKEDIQYYNYNKLITDLIQFTITVCKHLNQVLFINSSQFIPHLYTRPLILTHHS